MAPNEEKLHLYINKKLNVKDKTILALLIKRK
jgi:hypothetical protein